MTVTPDPNPLDLGPEILGALVLLVQTAQEIPTPLESADQYELATQTRDALNNIKKQVEARRERALRPVLDEANRIRGLADVLFDQLKPVIQTLDGMRKAYVGRVTNPTITVATVTVDGPVPDLSATVQPAPAEAPKMRVRKQQDIQVFDLSRVPDEFFDLNMARLREAVLKNGRDVPGVSRIEKEIPL